MDRSSRKAILESTSAALERTLEKRLGAAGFQVIVHSGAYVLARRREGERVYLVAHLDTVYGPKGPLMPVREREVTLRDGVWTGTNACGGDDRGGVIAILEAIERIDVPVGVLFCHDEEIGCLGAQQVPALEDARCFVEADRRGLADVVFYDVSTPAFEQAVLPCMARFGFHRSEGRHTDICVLGRRSNRCGVNLSTGFAQEHTLAETLDDAHVTRLGQEVLPALVRELSNGRWPLDAPTA